MWNNLMSKTVNAGYNNCRWLLLFLPFSFSMFVFAHGCTCICCFVRNKRTYNIQSRWAEV